jgi:hypothetical protein
MHFRKEKCVQIMWVINWIVRKEEGTNGKLLGKVKSEDKYLI